MRTPLTAPLTLLLALTAAACSAVPSGAPLETGAESGAAAGESALLPSVQATTRDDTVTFVLQVTNTGAAPVELEFRSGMRSDFVVLDGEREVWRWSADRMFTQAIEHDTLPAGETLTFTATWLPPASLSGELVVRGVLAATGNRVEQQARFRIP